jgi:phenylalanyl-tRNA synthetase beta chain
MKFSLNLASHTNNTDNTGVDPLSYDVDEVVSRIGLQLGSVESVENFAHKYSGAVVAKVVSCVKHPNADKLSLCLIDDGNVTADIERNQDGHVQVVCGAPNVREGMYVVWLPPGATVPSSHGLEPFVLDTRELRGKMSNGMLASPKELDMSEEHDGILELSISDIGREPEAGENFGPLFGMDDTVIDCENKMFTHRPDCFGNIGIARELSGIFGDTYTSPDWYTSPIKHEIGTTLPLNVENDIQSLVPRFMVQVVSGVEVKQSPLWLQAYLMRVGQKSINNIVDYTNFFMLETGQPLHAFDYDKLAKLSGDTPTVHPRMALKNEKIALLNGKTIELSENDIVIATDKQAISVGGVMGGTDTEVDDTTKNIVIEVANFDMYAIRRTSMRHGLFTDAVTRFNKGQSPLQNDRVLAKMVDEVVKYAQGTVASEVFDIRTFELGDDNLNEVEVSAEFINSRLGTDISAEAMKILLENVEFVVKLSDIEPKKSNLKITVPFWRMDIALKEDTVEEIGRLYGYQKIDAVLPVRSTKPAPKNEMRDLKQSLRDTLAGYGANEVVTYSFVHGNLLLNTGTDPDKWAYHVRNALSPDLQYYRTSLTPSLLAKVRSNIKVQAGSPQNEFALFEIGKAHVKGNMEDKPEDNLPKQMRRIAFVLAADAKTATKYDSAPYYQAKKYVDELTKGRAQYTPLESSEYPMTSVYQIGRSAVVTLGDNDQIIGVIGEYNAKAKKNLKLPDYCAGFELDIDLLKECTLSDAYVVASQYPTITQDVTYEVAADTSWASLRGLIGLKLTAAEKKQQYSTVIEPLDIFQQEKSDKKRMSFRIIASHPNKTLRSEEVTKLLDDMTESVNEKLQAIRI